MGMALSTDELCREGFCPSCKKPSPTLYYQNGNWLCRHCMTKEESEFPYYKEMGAANPFDPKGSTAHVRDIQDRRWHPKEKRLFYWSREKPKSYFLPKG